MSPKNAILVLIIMACISFGTLFYLVKTRGPINRVNYKQTSEENENINKKTEIIPKELTKEERLKKAEEFMAEVEKNNPNPDKNLSPEEKEARLAKAEAFMKLVEENSKIKFDMNSKDKDEDKENENKEDNPDFFEDVPDFPKDVPKLE